ncbi:sensor histidine kinase [Oxalicibacterium faecigallinarum]|uniref:histidine kinase n=1 Tax=Oxalicibacterium faecigallinarum TaxID=573741 RepID=A0A8J3AS53_9BURK|nr:ATP-binding protein [Oxalicibacterium faecigallinarum]GGI20208.1 two-component sensor histidine kinase [Oxalicibacterium faecigallinarum]
MNPAVAMVTDVRETFWRTLQTFAFTRTLIVAVLLGYFGWANPKAAHGNGYFWIICLAYMLLALGFVLLASYWRRRFLLQVSVQIMVDLAAITLLYMAVGGLRSGLAILYLFPLAGGAILAPLVMALFFVSVATFAMLAENGYQLLNDNGDISSTQVGLYCAAFFIIIIAINRLADRLIKQESLAQGRGKALQVQQAINRLVIEDMDDGILVVDRNGRILTGNPAAERLLGLSITKQHERGRLDEVHGLSAIADAYDNWRDKANTQTSRSADQQVFVRIQPVVETTLQSSTTIMAARRESSTHLKLRFVRVESSGVQEERVVIFLQDVTEIENQAQQLKLASMGRLTASIAHEVRNPLSAIGHAAALLNEDETDTARKRLLKIVQDNVARLNRMIEDILKLSRKANHDPLPLEISTLIHELVAELREMSGVKDGVIAVTVPASVHVRFDPLHLREIILNLLTNALRYASGKPGSIHLRLLAVAGHRAELHVQDDGPQMSPTVRAHLFEPFYTTSSKGTGLGLYLARELCLNNGAKLNYEYRSDDELALPSGRFVISFAAEQDLNQP